MRETTKGNTMGKRIWAAFLAGVVLLTSLWVRVPEMTSYATDLPIDYTGPLPMDRFTFACIDSHELLGGKGGVYAGPDTGHPDIYKRVVPSSVLSPRDEAILFWAGLALFGSSGNGPDCVPVLEKANAAGAGISYSCGHPAFANDLKCLIHSDAYVAKYPWIMCTTPGGTICRRLPPRRFPANRLPGRYPTPSWRRVSGPQGPRQSIWKVFPRAATSWKKFPYQQAL